FLVYVAKMVMNSCLNENIFNCRLYATCLMNATSLFHESNCIFPSSDINLPDVCRAVSPQANGCCCSLRAPGRWRFFRLCPTVPARSRTLGNDVFHIG